MILQKEAVDQKGFLRNSAAEEKKSAYSGSKERRSPQARERRGDPQIEKRCHAFLARKLKSTPSPGARSEERGSAD